MMAFGCVGGSTFLVEGGEAGRTTELTGHVSQVAAVRFSSDGSALVTASCGTMHVWAVDGHFLPSGDQTRQSKILNPPMLY